MVQNSGTDATSVAMCAVTAISRPDGTAASATQIALSRQVGAAAGRRRGVGRRRFRQPVGRAQHQTAAARDQHDQDIVAGGPEPGLIAEPHERLDRDRIGDQREKAADVARGIEEVRVLRVRMAGAHEPGLQQRTVGGEREERQPDRDGEQPEQPERLADLRRPAPSAGDVQRQQEARRRQDDRDE